MFIAAPHYLALTEKVDLCSSTPVNRGQDSVKCLTAVEGASKAFKNGPKKALGYFLDSLWDARYKGCALSFVFVESHLVDIFVIPTCMHDGILQRSKEQRAAGAHVLLQRVPGSPLICRMLQERTQFPRPR